MYRINIEDEGNDVVNLRLTKMGLAVEHDTVNK